MKFNVQVEITPIGGLPHTVNVYTESPSAGHAKGEAQYKTQLANPGKRIRIADCYEVLGPCLTPVRL